ncbi:MAG: 50S ribosomal protein L2 [Candidatus Acetothermia bacterium]|jgi:large subunit ribosomal protein L2|nr:50S ribosomal protein L2 [Candidatus Acetothermia bacterium]MDH7505550.1 50S ribosomal protein L2 [Candidatus Acetothermia bacterium]
MALKRFKPTSPGLRHAEWPDYSELTTDEPEESLLVPLRKEGGRNNQGKVTVRHRGGGNKRFYRLIDFHRDKVGIPAKVVSREYDPNRSAWITLLHYADGEKRYILAPLKLEIGETVEAGENAEPKVGNALPLRKIPLGTFVHGVELRPGGGSKVARAAGTAAQVMGIEDGTVRLRLPSGEMRLFAGECMATIGQLSNIDHKNVKHGQAGRVRRLGRRPHVRGVAMNPVDHPHGGGEGRHRVGRQPVSSTGKLAHGPRTRKKHKPSDKLIVRRAREERRT